MQCTVVIGIDRGTIEQFKTTFPAWKRLRPEIFEWPWLVFFEPENEKALTSQELGSLYVDLGVQDIEFVAWNKNHYHSQREKMVTGHVFVPARAVNTKWFVKIDTDAYATDPRPVWPKPDWFEPDDAGELNAFVGSKWGYTRAKGGGPLNDDLRAWCQALEAFGDVAFPDTPRLEIERRISSWDHPKGPKMRWKEGRLASWICFQRTDWVQQMAGLFNEHCGDCTLPVPSHDTALWYAAVRSQQRFTVTKMSRYGFANRCTMGSLRSEVGKVLAVHG